MTKIRSTFTLVTSLIAFAASSHGAVLINEYPTGSSSNITVTASSQINGFNQPLYTLTTALSNAEFNPGILDTPGDGQHGASTRQSWRANNSTAVDAAEEWIQWDLGSSFTLDSIQVWNYNDSSRFESGIRTVDIYISNVANPGDPEGSGAANWSLWGDNVTLLGAPGAGGYTGFDLATAVGGGEFALDSVLTRYVRFEVNSTFIGDGIDLPGGGNLGGQNASLSQIEFFAVPEPSVALLSGLGALLLLRRRKH